MYFIAFFFIRMDDKQYEEYAHRTPDSGEFADLKQSLHTIHDIRDIKFRPDDVDLPDPASTTINIFLRSETAELRRPSRNGGFEELTI